VDDHLERRQGPQQGYGRWRTRPMRVGVKPTPIPLTAGVTNNGVRGLEPPGEDRERSTQRRSRSSTGHRHAPTLAGGGSGGKVHDRNEASTAAPRAPRTRTRAASQDCARRLEHRAGHNARGLRQRRAAMLLRSAPRVRGEQPVHELGGGPHARGEGTGSGVGHGDDRDR
jgi:hypothetical protein